MFKTMLILVLLAIIVVMGLSIIDVDVFEIGNVRIVKDSTPSIQELLEDAGDNVKTLVEDIIVEDRI